MLVVVMVGFVVVVVIIEKGSCSDILLATTTIRKRTEMDKQSTRRDKQYVSVLLGRCCNTSTTTNITTKPRMYTGKEPSIGMQYVSLLM